jgi:putative Mg2+ transporter-C (MgtC) family protein
MFAALQSLETAFAGWAASLGWPGEGLLRLIIAVALGGLVGLEREVRGRQAGFRANMLVCVGSALVMIVSIRFSAQAWVHSQNVNINIDPARIAYGVMTGIGFLGAGTIMQTRGSIRGLTTAAGLWCVAAMGLAVGFGLYLISIGAALLILVILWFMDYISNNLPHQHYREIIVRVPFRAGCIDLVIGKIESAGIRVIDHGYERTHDLSQLDIRLHITYFRAKRYYDLEKKLEREEDCELMASRNV